MKELARLERRALLACCALVTPRAAGDMHGGEGTTARVVTTASTGVGYELANLVIAADGDRIRECGA
jgi:hypothetical protein